MGKKSLVTVTMCLALEFTEVFMLKSMSNVLVSTLQQKMLFIILPAASEDKQIDLNLTLM